MPSRACYQELRLLRLLLLLRLELLRLLLLLRRAGRRGGGLTLCEKGDAEDVK